MQRVVIIGGGNAAFCAALAARETGADVLLVQGNVPAHQTDARAALAAARMANSALALEQALMVCSYAFNQPWHEDEWRAAYEERIALARREHNVWAECDARRLRLEHLMQIVPRAQMEAEQAPPAATHRADRRTGDAGIDAAHASEAGNRPRRHCIRLAVGAAGLD